MSRFILTTESVNRYGYWIHTKGLELGQFKRNPIMYFMHKRPDADKVEDVMLPIGRWADIKVEKLTAEMCAQYDLDASLVGTDAITAEAVFDENDPFAVKVKSKVEGGFLKMASVGVEPTEYDLTASKEGQTAAAILRGSLVEASIVDRGGNDDAIRLSASGATVHPPTIQSKIDTMTILLSDPIKKVLVLAGPSVGQAEVEAAILALAARADKVVVLEGEIETLRKAENERKMAVLDEMLMSQELRLTAPQQEAYRTLAAGSYDATLNLVKTLPKHKPLHSTTEGGDGPEGREKWTFDDYQRKDPVALAKLRMDNPTHYKALLAAYTKNV